MLDADVLGRAGDRALEGLASVEVGALSASPFEAAVVDEIEPVKRTRIDGVIGLDFLWRFERVWQDDGEALRPLTVAL